jgi:hypothetical protein
MVAVPVLADFVVFGATTNDTLPVPVPPASGVTFIHFSSLLTVHRQVLDVETDTVNVPPTGLASRLVGLMAYEQRVSVDVCVCVTVKVSPAMARVPVRVLPERLSALNPTVPFPVPDAPEVIAIHPTLLVALHEQPAPAETATVPPPPVLAMEALVGLIA